LTPRQAGLLGLLAALWGASYLLIKYALDDFSPACVVFLRTAIGALVLLGVVLLRGGEVKGALSDVRRRPGLAGLLGLLAIAAPFLLISYGEERVPSGLTAVLIAPAPLFVAVLAPLFDRSEAIRGAQAVGLVVGLVGVALLVGAEAVATLAQFASAVGILAAAACYALSGFIVKNAYRGVPAVTTSCISVGAGALLALPFAVASPPTHAPGLRSVLSLVVLGALGTALAFVIFYRLIAEVGAGRAALVTYLVPPLSLTYGALLLGEAITAAAVAGLLLILGGVALAARRPAVAAAPD
jgi:drug/metabolite transporter (DMT)-like permease